MIEQSANKAHFSFITAACSPDTFHVIDWHCKEEISRPYQIDLTLSSEDSNISVEDMTGSNATLYIYRDDQFHPFSGIVIKCTYIGKTIDYCRYTVTLVPKIWLLSQTIRSRVFQNSSVVAVIEQVLKDAELTQSCTLNCGSHPEREFIMQYDESDLDFISRLMEQSGIWYSFTEDPVAKSALQSPGTEQMIISDQPSSFPISSTPDSLSFREASGLKSGGTSDAQESVAELSVSKQFTPASLSLKNYNYRTPEVDISTSASIEGGINGTINRFGGSPKNVSEIQQAATIGKQRFTTGHTVISGMSNCRSLRAGTKITIADSPRDDTNTTVLVTAVDAYGTHPEIGILQSEKTTYYNTFSSVTGTGMLNYRPPIRTPQPKIPGVFTAAIEGQGSEYAHLDDQGRYHVRIPFDTAESSNSEASKPIRLSQPYSGSDYGIHFPSHENSEMILGCINGDPDKPIGLGTVPNANTISPVRSTNKHTSIIRTAGGNEIILDDMDKKQKVSIKSNAQHTLLLDDELKKITLKSTDDNKLVLDDENKTVAINAQENLLSLTYDDNGSKITIVTKDGHSILLDDENKCIQIQSTGGHKVVLDDENEVLVLTDEDGTNTVTLDRSAGISLETQQDISIKADGDFNLEAANVTVQSGGNAEVTADGDVSVQGVNVAIEADANASINGGAQLDATGGNATFEASGMGEVKAGGVMTVQGSVVNIN